MNLLLIDDHSLFSQSLRFLLREMNADIQITVAGNIADAVGHPGPFDLVLLDLHLPDTSGMLGLQAVKGRYPDAPVVMLSSEEGLGVIRAAIDAGAMGYVPKSSTPEVLMAAMQLILAGGTYLPTGFLLSTDATGRTAAQGQATLSPLSQLTDRQKAVLLKVVQGKANKAIARELSIAESTVKSHLSSAYQVLGVTSRTEAVVKAAKLRAIAG